MIGDAAVKAGLVGLPLVIIIALTAVSSFVIPTLYEANTMLRFLFILVGGTLGLYGVFLGFFLLIVNICSLQTLGVPITAPAAPFQPGGFRDLFWRASWSKLQKKTYSVGKTAERNGGNSDAAKE